MSKRNTMTNYEKLRAKCYEIIYPDGIPLEFGCEIKGIGGDYFDVIDVEHNGRVTVREGWVITKKTFQRNYKILGKPLELRDLLKIIKKTGDYAITSRGQIMMFIDDEGYGQPMGIKLPKLDLSKPISEQSEETLDALIELV